MSEDDLFFESQGESQHSDSGPGDQGDEDNNEEVEISETIEEKYERAKNDLHFDNESSMEGFLSVFNNDSTPLKLKIKALCKALRLSQAINGGIHTLKLFKAFFDFQEKNLIPQNRFKKTLSLFLSTLSPQNENYADFLRECLSCFNNDVYEELYIEITILRSDNELKNGNYHIAKSLLETAETQMMNLNIIGNSSMNRVYIKLLALLLEIALINKDFDKANTIHESMIKSLDSNNTTPRINGLLKRMKSMNLLESNMFSQAKASFFEAFQIFCEIGNSQRADMLMYYALSSMLTLETTDIFLISETHQFTNHPIVAPIHQLFRAYLNGDLAEFDLKVPSVLLAIGHRTEFFGNLIRLIRSNVLLRSVARFCEAFSCVQISYIANELHSDEKEVLRSLQQLIVRGKTSGLIDYTKMLYIRNPHVEISHFLSEAIPILSALENILK